jgi:hypothetical protein
MNFKPLILPVVLVAGLGAVYFLPQAGSVANTAISMKLPEQEDSWSFRSIPPSPEELAVLASDTQFSKAICLKPRPGERTADGLLVPDRLDLSIVLSGYDLNNSIHRPERCMPAQGHTILSGTDVPLTLANGRTLTVRRLLSTQKLPTSADHKSSQELSCVTYYFFVGHDQTAHDHLQRTILDMKDRIVRGMDQRWAYASVSMWYGKVPWIEPEVTEKEADEKVSAFLSEFAKDQIDWNQVLP